MRKGFLLVEPTSRKISLFLLVGLGGFSFTSRLTSRKLIIFTVLLVSATSKTSPTSRAGSTSTSNAVLLVKNWFCVPHFENLGFGQISLFYSSVPSP